MKKITMSAISLIIALATITALAGCTDKSGDNTLSLKPSGAEDATYEKHPDVPDPLRIGVPNVSFPPMITWDGGSLTGFEADMIAETAKRLGVSYEIIPIEPGTEREKLEDDEIDCAWGNMPDTGRQRLFYNMTDPYITVPQAVLVYDGSGIGAKEDINSISVIMSTPAETLADEEKLGIGFKRASSSRDYVKTFEQLAEGYSDAVVCDITVAAYMQKNDGKLKILDDKAAEAQYSVAFSHSGDKGKIKEAADKVLKDISNEGKASELSQKWFGQDYMK